MPHHNSTEEQEILNDLGSYAILNTLPEEDFDNLTNIASHICGTPISLISLVDQTRQWFKSNKGLSTSETPREYAFCAYAIQDPNDIFIVPDARLDSRFKDNPLVTGDPNIVFYAGVPLVTNDGNALGTLCVIDSEPKVLSEAQLDSLRSLAQQVMALLRLRKSEKKAQWLSQKLKEKNVALERFAFVAAHDLKSPLISISGLSEMLLSEYADKLDDTGKHMLTLLDEASDQLKRLVDGLLEFSRNEKIIREKKTVKSLCDLEVEMKQLFSFEINLHLKFTANLTEVIVNHTAVSQILLNLIGNAIKYGDKPEVIIDVDIWESDSHYHFCVADNGPGIKPDNHETIFKAFKVMKAQDKYGKTGNGIGLAVVQKLVTSSNGTIDVDSEKGQGARFTFTLGK